MTKKKTPIICALDTEIDYDDKVSLKHLSTRQVVEHPRFNCYMVSLANDDFSRACHPKDVNWEDFEGATFICHNASFDQYVFEQLQKEGIIPPINVEFICSADMVTYFQLPRPLAWVTKVLFKHDMPKDMRDWMKGKSWEDAVNEGKAEALLKYAEDDAIWTWRLYKKLYKKWPESERILSKINREMCWEGLPIDQRSLRKALKHMEKQIWEIQQRLPWYEVVDPDTKKPYALTGKKGLNTYLQKEGFPTITSTAKTSNECNEWIEKHGARCSYVADFQTMGRIQKHYAALKKLYERTDDRSRFSYSLIQYGVPSTQRWKGAGGWSVHNGFPRAVQYGVDLRSMVRAPKGHKLIVSDLGQIEPRCSAFITNDKDALESFKKGVHPYQYHAETTMNWTGGSLKKEDPNQYALAKERVLALGYGVGWARLLKSARDNGFGEMMNLEVDKSDENAFLNFLEKVPSQSHFIDQYDIAPKSEKRAMVNAWIQVMDFRRKSPLIKQLWDHHAAEFQKCAGSAKTYEIKLPSGRVMKFFRPRGELDGISCTHTQGNKMRVREYGASLYQKSIQATARDVFAYHLGLLHKEGIKVIMHVHDEIVAEVEDKKVDESLEIIRQVMTTTPPWADIPLECDAVVTDTYLK